MKPNLPGSDLSKLCETVTVWKGGGGCGAEGEAGGWSGQTQYTSQSQLCQSATGLIGSHKDPMLDLDCF